MIDCDVHCAPASMAALDEHLAPSWRQLISNASMGLMHLSDAYPPGVPTTMGEEDRAAGRLTPPATYDELKARVLDRSDASHWILNCLTMFEIYRNPYMQAAVASAINDWLREEWLARDERLRASIVVPWTNTEAAVAEVERVGDHSGFVQVLLPVRADGLWGQPAHHALYAAASERGLAIALHAWGTSGRAPSPTGFTTTYFEDYLSNATIAQQQVLSFIAEGVLDRHPELRLVVLECGFSWLPSMMWRMDKDWRGLWPEVPWVKDKPSSYVRGQVSATIQPAQLGSAKDHEIVELVHMLGAQSLLYASDYPHCHGGDAERLLAAVDTETRDAIVSGNAAALYGPSAALV